MKWLKKSLVFCATKFHVIIEDRIIIHENQSTGNVQTQPLQNRVSKLVK